jgi:thiamine-phosphate pyrophosphorylase
MSAGATEAAGLRAQRSARLAGLYAITPEVEDTAALCAMVRAALRGGAAAIQYRAKTLPAPRRREQAGALAALCREHSALFIVNDDADLAAAVQADGVHVGRDDADPAAARARIGAQALVGVSCYDDVNRARALAEQGADYVAFGSLFPSSVKPHAVRASLDLVREASALPVPVVGIGGIDAGNAGAVIAAGARAVAVITAVFGADDIEAAARRLARACAAAPRAAFPSPSFPDASSPTRP